MTNLIENSNGNCYKTRQTTSSWSSKKYILLFLAVTIAAACAAGLSFINKPNSNTTGAVGYLEGEDLNKKLIETNEKCPEITELFSIGESYLGQEIKGIQFGSSSNFHNLKSNNFLNITTIGLIGNMHGNEATGRAILTWFISFLCDTKSTEFSQKLLQNTVITILPTINPDGFSDRLKIDVSDTEGSLSYWTRGRYAYDPTCTGSNCDNIDMNRDFPDASRAYHDNNSNAFNRKFYESDSFKNNYSQNSKSKESNLVRQFLKNNSLDFALNFHDGATVVSYPLDLAQSNIPTSGQYSKSPDDDIYIKLAKIYADQWPKVNTNCRNEFPSGITNGADWYSLAGGLQDYSYMVYGTLHMTIEVSCIKFPDENILSDVVEDNKNSLKTYLTNLAEQQFPKVYGFSLARVDELINFEKDGNTYFTYVLSGGRFNRILPENGAWNILDSNGAILGNVVVDGNTEVFV